MLTLSKFHNPVEAGVPFSMAFDGISSQAKDGPCISHAVVHINTIQFYVSLLQTGYR